MRFLAPLLAAALLAGCNFPYKIDVQQGNFVTQDLVDKLKPGMTRAEVKQLLGTPLLTDVFHNDRWDYYFSNLKGGKAENRSTLTIYFKDDKLASFTGAGRPGKTPDEQINAPNPAPPNPAAANPAPNPATR